MPGLRYKHKERIQASLQRRHHIFSQRASVVKSIKAAGLIFANPFIAASGTFGYADSCLDFYHPDLLGGFVLKGISLEPRKGNSPMRIIETPSGMINAIGLENIGIERLIKDKIPFIETLHSVAIANLYAETKDDFIELAEKINEIKRIDAVEINISCPNVKSGGMQFGVSPEMTENLTKNIKKVSSKPVIVKLSPNVTDICEIAKAAEGAGADALSLINTISAMIIDTKKMLPALANVTGGLSGPAILPIAVRMVYQVYEAVSIPIIGGGGISSVNDALQFVMAGASLVSIGTYNFISPASIPVIIKQFNNEVKKTDYSYSDLIGIAHRQHFT
ncbi:MAG: dihydroorotate dehydrogenase [Epsilonproteobacteria bacterium]|nr:dihydroorotate dehydrogenase [Campylobacterota bacterium]